MNQPEMTLNIKLTITDTNTVLRALGMLPYNEVAALLQNIKAQGDSQVAQAAQPATSQVAQAAQPATSSTPAE